MRFGRHPVTLEIYLLLFNCEAMIFEAYSENLGVQEMCASPGETFCRLLQCACTIRKYFTRHAEVQSMKKAAHVGAYKTVYFQEMGECREVLGGGPAPPPKL
jgi:hypothetical protein